MRSFLTQLIPKKMDNQILCRVIGQIWISPKELQKPENFTKRTNKDKLETVDEVQEDDPKLQSINGEHGLKLKAQSGSSSSDTADLTISTELSSIIKKETNKVTSVTASITSETTVIMRSQEIEHDEEEKKEPARLVNVDSSGEATNIEFEELTNQKRAVCASNEFERDEERDLQEILMRKLQLNLPEVLREETRRDDLFQLPREALEIVFSNSETCCSEHQLFRAIKEQLTKTQEVGEVAFTTELSEEQAFLKSMLKYVRLPLMNMKQLVTDVKFSGFFNDQAIFEAL